jgi:hypothetical protein
LAFDAELEAAAAGSVWLLLCGRFLISLLSCRLAVPLDFLGLDEGWVSSGSSAVESKCGCLWGACAERVLLEARALSGWQLVLEKGALASTPEWASDRFL